MADGQSRTPDELADDQLHRCFIAVRPCDRAVEYIGSVIDSLRSHQANVKWVSRQNVHLTLRFLGEIDDVQLAALRDTMWDESALDGFTLRLRGLGAFPSMRSPKVLWTGVEGEHQSDLDALLHVHGRAERWARGVGVAPENRKFEPHVTIGRVRMPPTNVRALMADLGGRECTSPWCRISAIDLVESTLTPTGSIYRTIASVALHRV